MRRGVAWPVRAARTAAAGRSAGGVGAGNAACRPRFGLAGAGFLAVVADAHKDAAIAAIGAQGIAAWQVGTVHTGARPAGDFEEGAKGVDGGAVRLVGAYANGNK